MSNSNESKPNLLKIYHVEGEDLGLKCGIDLSVKDSITPSEENIWDLLQEHFSK